MSFPILAAIAFGGALGSVLRFGASEAVRVLAGARGFPLGTLLINVAGSLLLGWFLRWASSHEASMPLRAFVAVGLCGGFTTFSTFAVENLALLQQGAIAKALFYSGLSLVLTVGGAFVGYSLAK